MKLLLINRKLVLRGRKLALAIAGCFARCCATQSWNRADLCNEDEFPPDVPRIITFPAGFVCGDSCPVSGGRIIIYAGRCYTVVSGTGTVQCQGPRTAPAVYLAPFPGATVVSWQELSCKPLTATCLDETCVPIEPGCCSDPYQFRACDLNTPVTCALPKRFRVRRVAQWRWRSWLVTNFNDCSGYYCEEMTLDIDGYADYQCVEGNPSSRPVCIATGGGLTISGWVDTTGVGGNINGFHPFGEAIGSLFNGIGPGVPADATNFGIPSNVLARLHAPFASFPFCGGNHTFTSDPPGCFTQSVTCPMPDRSILIQSANCANGTFDNTVYRDCFLWDQVYNSQGNYLPPCAPNEAWNDSGLDRVTLSALAGCQNQPAWEAPPTGPGRPSLVQTAALTSTAAMLQGMAG